MGFFLGISRPGSLVAVALGGLLTDGIGYRPTLLLFATLSAVAAPISAPTGGRISPQPKSSRRNSPKEHLNHLDPRPARRLLERPDIAVRRRLRAVYVCGYAHDLVMSGVVTASIRGLLLSCRWPIDFGLGPYLGHVSDRLGRHRMILAAFLPERWLWCRLAA